MLHRLLGHVEEGHDILQHAHCLVEGAVAVVVGVGVLLEEVVLDQLGHLQDDLVRLGQRALDTGGHRETTTDM